MGVRSGSMCVCGDTLDEERLGIDALSRDENDSPPPSFYASPTRAPLPQLFSALNHSLAPTTRGKGKAHPRRTRLPLLPHVASRVSVHPCGGRAKPRPEQQCSSIRAASPHLHEARARVGVLLNARGLEFLREKGWGVVGRSFSPTYRVQLLFNWHSGREEHRHGFCTQRRGVHHGRGLW